MTAPAEFLPRVLATVDDLALRLSHTPRERQHEWIQGFAERVRAQWGELFAPVLSADDVDGMVEDVVARVLAQRDQIELTRSGTA